MENTEDTLLDNTEAQLLEAMTLYSEEETPVYKAFAGDILNDDMNKAKLFDIVESIKTVYDPEIPINVYDLGLIYKIDQLDNGNVHIDMSLTAPGCPVAGILPQQVADVVAGIDGVGKVEVEIVWEPAWTPERLTEEAKMILEML